MFEWSGYEDPLLNPAYIAKYPDGPEFAFFGDEDEAFEKMRAGFKADVAHPCSQSVVKWRDAGLLQPLDTSKIAGWNDMLPGFMGMKNLMTDDSGKAWFLPFDWGNTALHLPHRQGDRGRGAVAQDFRRSEVPATASRSATMSTTPMRWRASSSASRTGPR